MPKTEKCCTCGKLTDTFCGGCDEPICLDCAKAKLSYLKEEEPQCQDCHDEEMDGWALEYGTATEEDIKKRKEKGEHYD